MATTRLGQFGVGVDAYPGFLPRSTQSRGSQQFTRLTQCGIGGAKYGTFLPKGAAAQPEQEEQQATGGILLPVRKRRGLTIRGRIITAQAGQEMTGLGFVGDFLEEDDEEVLLLVA